MFDLKQDVSFVSRQFLALLAGLSAGGAMSYSGCWSVLVLAQGLLVWLLTRSAQRPSSGLLVFLFALGNVLGANYWLGIAIYHPPVNGLIAACLISGVLLLAHAASYTILYMLLHVAVNKTRLHRSLSHVLPLTVGWGVAELARSVGTWAMPWGLLGYGHLDNPVLRGLYPVIGGHGVAGASWLMAALVLSTVGALGSWRRTRRLDTSQLRRVGLVVAILIAAALTALVDWTRPEGRALAV
ncbi:MAG: hypothetical protein EON92_14905, partial [Burkholderiales bacterium]